MTKTQLSRRGFIGATGGALVGAAVMPAALHAAEIPVLHADGIHDDTHALEALFAGRPVQVVRENVVARYENGTLRLINGQRLHRPLHLPRGRWPGAALPGVAAAGVICPGTVRGNLRMPGKTSLSAACDKIGGWRTV